MKDKIIENKPLYNQQEYKELLYRYSQSGGSQKLWNYFVEISRTDKFQKNISLLKKKYEIPEMGFPLVKNTDLGKRINDPGYCYRLLKETQKIEVCIDGYLIPPNAWKLKNTDQESAFDVDVMNLCSQNCLHWVYWQDVIKFLVFHNTLHRIPEGGFDLCMISDLREEKEDPFSEIVQGADNDAYPIAIRVSPYASQRDILDYVKKVYKPQIEPVQARYKNNSVRIGRVKRKKENIQQRNDFIYNNRELPRKEIMRLVSKKFNELLDYGLIGKIISIEKERRRDV